MNESVLECHSWVKLFRRTPDHKAIHLELCHEERWALIPNLLLFEPFHSHSSAIHCNRNQPILRIPKICERKGKCEAKSGFEHGVGGCRLLHEWCRVLRRKPGLAQASLWFVVNRNRRTNYFLFAKLLAADKK